MPANADDQCCVYYISDASCADPYRHGYIGITSNEVSRQYAHRRSGRFPAEFVWTILFRGRDRNALPWKRNIDRIAALAGTPILAVAAGAIQKSTADARCRREL
jgi:hypothetical protein